MNDPHGFTKENLLNALPAALKKDPKILALAGAIAGLLVRQKEETGRLSIYPQIDELDEALLDILAYDFKVDWWDSDYSLTEKRRTLQAALEKTSKAMEKLDADVREHVKKTLAESLSGLKKGEAGGVAPLGEDGKVPNDYINAQGGLVAQEEPPENTTLGWIDTVNGNILKFYRDGDWVSVSAVWG